MFRIRPAVGINEPQRNEDVKGIFNACKILPEDSKHYSVVYHISAKMMSVPRREGCMGNYGELWGTMGNYYSCGADKGTPTAALIPSPVGTTPEELAVKEYELQSRQCIIINSKDPVRSHECGCRNLYKKHGQRMLVYDAR